MPTWFSSSAQRYRVVLIGALLAFCIGILVAAWTALVPFFLGLILAYLFLPAVNFFDSHAPRLLRSRRWSRPLAILLVYIVAVGLVAGVLSFFIPVVSGQAKLLGQIAPGLLRRVERLFAIDIDAFLEAIPEDIRTAVDANVRKATQTVVDAIQLGLEVTIRTLFQTVAFIMGMVIIPFWLFYVLNDEAKARRAFYGLIPQGAREDVRCIMAIVDRLLSAYIRGQFLLCLLIGVMTTVALLALGVDFALLLGTVAGIFEVIPIFGPYIGAIPAVLIALLERPILALWVALSFTAIQQIENVLLVPRISGRAMRFHPALVMVVVIVGAEVAGLWGLVLAVPLAAMIRDVFQYLYLRTTERGATPEMAMEYLRAQSFRRSVLPASRQHRRQRISR